MLHPRAEHAPRAFSQILGSLLENVPCLTYKLESCASARVLLRKTAAAGVARELMDLTKDLVNATCRTLGGLKNQVQRLANPVAANSIAMASSGVFQLRV